MIDDYCERLGPGMWAEPLNVISNLSFFVAAWLLWRYARKNRMKDTGGYMLIALIAVIGVGSTLFHTFANRLTEWMDVIPILLFQLALLWLYTRSAMRFSIISASALLAFYFLINIGADKYSVYYHGSFPYFPTLITVFCLGTYHLVSRQQERWLLMAASLVFAISLTSRTIDTPLCKALPIGTHFVWHLLNGLVLYLATRATLLTRNPR